MPRKYKSNRRRSQGKKRSYKKRSFQKRSYQKRPYQRRNKKGGMRRVGSSPPPAVGAVSYFRDLSDLEGSSVRLGDDTLGGMEASELGWSMSPPKRGPSQHWDHEQDLSELPYPYLAKTARDIEAMAHSGTTLEEAAAPDEPPPGYLSAKHFMPPNELKWPTGRTAGTAGGELIDTEEVAKAAAEVADPGEEEGYENTMEEIKSLMPPAHLARPPFGRGPTCHIDPSVASHGSRGSRGSRGGTKKKGPSVKRKDLKKSTSSKPAGPRAASRGKLWSGWTEKEKKILWDYILSLKPGEKPVWKNNPELAAVRHTPDGIRQKAKEEEYREEMIEEYGTGESK